MIIIMDYYYCYTYHIIIDYCYVGINVRGHERAYELTKFKSLPVRHVINTLYPRLFALHAIADNDDYVIPCIDMNSQEVDIHTLPRVPVLTSEYFELDGLYLLNDSHILWIYMGRNLPPTDLYNWFNYDVNNSTFLTRPKFLSFNTEHCIAAKNMQSALELIDFHSPYKHEIRLVWGDDTTSINFEKFATRLIEDSIKGEMSYVDFLCKVHSKIQSKP